MGKVSDYIIELGETFEDLLWHTGDWESAKRNLKNELSSDEFEFFEAYEDIIKDNLEMNDSDITEGSSNFDDQETDEEVWQVHFYDALENNHGLSPEEADELTIQYHKSIAQYFDAKKDPIKAANMIYKAFKGMHEAAGLKGDVLRPYGGRKARNKMGYGRGNRAGFNPEDEIETPEEMEMDDIIMQDIEDDDGAPLTSTIIDGEEVFDIGDEKPGTSEDDWIYGKENHDQRMKDRKEMLAKPYPVGSGGVDNVFDGEGRRIEESYIMPPLNEDWTFIQEAGLIIAAGAILIGIMTGKKGSPEALSWKAWMENKLDFIPAMRKRRVSREIKQGVGEYAEEKIDIDALEEILNQDPSLQKTIESLKTGNKYGYAQLYNKLKNHLDSYTIEGTPIKKIKGEFNKQGEKYKADLEANKKQAMEVLEWYGNGIASSSDVEEILSSQDEPGWDGLRRAFNKLIQRPSSYQNFYRAIKGFYVTGRITDTPGKKIRERIEREAVEAAGNGMRAGDPESFNKKHTMESLEMPSILEYGGRDIHDGHPQSKYDEDGNRKDPYADSGHTVNGKPVTWKELWYWYETEGEYGD